MIDCFERMRCREHISTKDENIFKMSITKGLFIRVKWIDACFFQNLWSFQRIVTKEVVIQVSSTGFCIQHSPKVINFDNFRIKDYLNTMIK